MTLDQLADRILERFTGRETRALLIGVEPPVSLGFTYVSVQPYDAVVLGILPPGELLHMPSDAVCCALLANIPVYLWQKQPYRHAKHGKLLCRRLLEAEERLLLLGVRPLRSNKTWIAGQNTDAWEEEL